MQRLLNTTKLFLKNEIINQAKTDITLIIVKYCLPKHTFCIMISYTLRKKRYKSRHWGCTFSKGNLLSILGANKDILGANMYFLISNMYILGANMYILSVNMYISGANVHFRSLCTF